MNSGLPEPTTDHRALEAFEALPERVAVLDGSGTIVAVNRSWTRFAVENGGVLERIGIGVNYLTICRNASADTPDADSARQGIEDVLAGRKARFETEYRCDGPNEERWFQLIVTPIGGGTTRLRGAVIMHRDISPWKQRERILRENRDRLREALSAARTGAWSVDLRTLQLGWSHEVEGLVGISELGNTLNELEKRVYPADAQRVKETIQLAIEERSEFACNLRIRDAQNRPRSVAILGQVHCDAIGIPASIVGTVHEIGDVGFYERTLEGQHRVLELIARGAALSIVLDEIVRLVEARLPGSRCSILLLDASGRRLRLGSGISLPKEYNDAIDGIEIGPNVGCCGTAVYFGKNVSVNDIERDPLWDDYRHLALRHGLRSCHSVPIFGSADDIHGGRGKILGTFALYRREAGEPLPGSASVLESAAHLAGIALDRERALRAAVESEERFRLLVDGVRDHAIFMTDATGRIMTWNPGAERIFGYAASEAIGSQVERLIPAEDCQIVGARAWLDGSDAKRRDERDRTFLRREGSHFAAEASTHALRETDGSLRGYAVMVHDLTERRRLEAQLRQSQKMEAIGQLAGGIAHDFNNLLTVINGFSELVLAGLPPKDSRRTALTAIRDAGERAAGLTSQLLVFSRQAMVEPKVLDLNSVVASTAGLLRRLIGEDIEIITELSPVIGHVRVDPGQLEQVLMNLAVNARDAMPRGGVLRIATDNASVERGQAKDGANPVDPERYVVMTVSDTGHGISDDVKSRIFEPFFTTKGIGKGTGLGLATVYGIVNQAGGHIAVESEVGIGTVFRVYLPVAVTERAAAIQSPTGQRIGSRGAETILLAEDEEEVRNLARLSLQMHGYRVLDAASGEDAMRLAQAHADEIDLLVTDVVMPEMGGRELANLLRQKQPQLKVLFMSGYTDDALVRHGVAAAADAFLQKPFTPSTLARKVRETLDADVRT